MKVSLLAPLRDRHALRVLLYLRSRGPSRFNTMQSALELNPAQLDRALALLTKGLWAIPETIPTKGRRIFLRYSASRRGEALLDAFDAFVAQARTKRGIFGGDELRQLEGFLAS